MNEVRNSSLSPISFVYLKSRQSSQKMALYQIVGVFTDGVGHVKRCLLSFSGRMSCIVSRDEIEIARLVCDFTGNTRYIPFKMFIHIFVSNLEI